MQKPEAEVASMQGGKEILSLRPSGQWGMFLSVVPHEVLQ